jgi:hypothetical protein
LVPKRSFVGKLDHASSIGDGSGERAGEQFLIVYTAEPGTASAAKLEQIVRA